jgi:hypothetical protein
MDVCGWSCGRLHNLVLAELSSSWQAIPSTAWHSFYADVLSDATLACRRVYMDISISKLHAGRRWQFYQVRAPSGRLQEDLQAALQSYSTRFRFRWRDPCTQASDYSCT